MVEKKQEQIKKFNEIKESSFEKYINHLSKNKKDEDSFENTPIYDQSFRLNEEIMQISKNLEEKHKK